MADNYTVVGQTPYQSRVTNREEAVGLLMQCTLHFFCKGGDEIRNNRLGSYVAFKAGNDGSKDLTNDGAQVMSFNYAAMTTSPTNAESNIYSINFRINLGPFP